MNIMDFSEFERHIKSGERCHLVGIGGVSMSPLAEILHGLGIEITGSDINGGAAVDRLRAMGISIAVGHSADNVLGAGFIIRTAAARDDNIEIQTAGELGIPVFERAKAWGYLMRDYKDAVCVSGAHGKTTTTSMITHILLAAGKDPTVMIGGTLPIIGSGYRVGEKRDVIVVESCEYYNSFHNFRPTVAVILNIDKDHLDYFHDIENIKSSFRTFASLVPDDGHIVCNGDDENTMQTLAPLGRPLLTFGLGENARMRGIVTNASGRHPSADILYDGEPFCKVTLQIPGLHNILNALAATAAAAALGIPPDAIEKGLCGYDGVGRRFEYKGCFRGADVYDDYAHHPFELRALLDTVSTLGYERVILAFQPHTYTRTKALFDDFVSELSRADVTLLAEIYAAREKNDVGISSGDLAAAIKGARCCPTLDGLVGEIASIAKPGDIVLTVGAGDIYTVGEALVAGRL